MHQDFTWQCSFKLQFSLDAFGLDLDGMSDGDARDALQAQSSIRGNGIGQHGLLNAHLDHAIDPEDGPDLKDRITFDKVFTSGNRRRVEVEITTPELDLSAFKSHIARMHDDALDPSAPRPPRADIRDATGASQHLASSITLRHPQINFLPMRGDTVGIDAPWNILFPPSKPAVSERCLHLTDYYSGYIKRPIPNEPLEDFRMRELDDRSQSRILFGAGHMTISRILNKDLFQQIFDIANPLRWDDAGEMYRHTPRFSFESLCWKTQCLILDRSGESSRREDIRMSHMMRWIDAQGDRLRLMNSAAGKVVLYNTVAIADWSDTDGRLKYRLPLRCNNERPIIASSQRITVEEIMPMLAAMVLDIIIAKKMLDNGENHETWTGVLSESLTHVREQLEGFGLYLPDKHRFS